MSKLFGGLGLIGLGLLALYGCSSNEQNGSTTASTGGTRVGAGGATGGSTANPANCPATQPAANATCPTDGLACHYGAEQCTCQQVRGGGGGQGGQAQTLAFTCVTCSEGAACTGRNSTCTNSSGQICTCNGSTGRDAGAGRTYTCVSGGGGNGPGGGGRGNATGGVTADPNCTAGLQCTAAQTCTSSNGYTCYCLNGAYTGC
jgi:hypothetical protein